MAGDEVAVDSSPGRGLADEDLGAGPAQPPPVACGGLASLELDRGARQLGHQQPGRGPGGCAVLAADHDGRRLEDGGLLQRPRLLLDGGREAGLQLGGYCVEAGAGGGGGGGGGHRGLGLHLHVAGVDDEAAAAREVCVHVWQLK